MGATYSGGGQLNGSIGVSHTRNMSGGLNELRARKISRVYFVSSVKIASLTLKWASGIALPI